MIKQNGGMLAKGRLLGVQFAAMLKDDLWLRAAAHADALAGRLARGFEAAGLTLCAPVKANMVFVILPIDDAEKLSKEFAFEFWSRYDDAREVYRFVTSWATPPEAVDALIGAVEALYAH